MFFSIINIGLLDFAALHKLGIALIAVYSFVKKQLAILALLISLVGFGQYPIHHKFINEEDIYVLNGDTLNGLYSDTTLVNEKFAQIKKYGYLVNLELKVPENAKGLSLIYRYRITVKGEFRKGQPFGKWILAKSIDPKYLFTFSGGYTTELDYKQGTVIYSFNEFSYSEEIYYVNDSSIVYGTLSNSWMKKNVSFFCGEESNCIFLTAENDTLFKCNLSELDWFIWKAQKEYLEKK